MPIVDLIFDWGSTIMSVFAIVAEWFITPISYDSLILYVSSTFGWAGIGVGFLTDALVDFEKIFGVSEITPIWLILGPGLVLFLFATLIKWILSFLPLF